MRGRGVLGTPVVLLAGLCLALVSCTSPDPRPAPSPTAENGQAVGTTSFAAAENNAERAEDCLTSERPSGDPASETGRILDIQFVSDLQGWAVGEGSVFHTDDGGERWDEQLQGVDVRAVQFLDSRHGWAVGDEVLLGTSDGGSCWRVIARPEPPLESVHFAEPELGWAVTAVDDGRGQPAGHVVRTTDGGRTWKQIPAPRVPTSVCFTDARRGWLGVTGAIYRSTDGGDAWSTAFVPPQESGVVPEDPATVQCAQEAVWVRFVSHEGPLAHRMFSVVYNVGEGSEVVVAACASTYHRPESSPDPLIGCGYQPGPISALDADTAWIASNDPIRFEADITILDGHRASTSRPIRPPMWVEGAAFRSRDLGWVTGWDEDRGSFIARTTDAGRTWTVQHRVQNSR